MFGKNPVGRPSDGEKSAAPTGRTLRLVHEAVLEALSPTRCAGCERPGELICAQCLDELELIDPVFACTRCGAPYGSLVCTECTPAAGEGIFDGSPIRRVLAMAVFSGPLPRIVRAYKDAGEQRLARVFAEMLLDTAEHAELAAPDRYGGLLSAADALTFVPVTAAAYRRRGFDHMEAIVSSMATAAGMPVVDALAKRGAADQRRLGRAGRMERARDAYEVVVDVDGLRMLLVDDVITTGSTVVSAAKALHRAGVAEVDVLALARVLR